MKTDDLKKSVVLFDDECNFCNASVNFIIRNNTKEDFLFVPLQSPYGKELLNKYAIQQDYLKSIVLIEDENIFFKSTATLRISKKLNGVLSLLYALILFPIFLRDAVYNWIAKHRSSWFKNQDHCMVPDARTRNLFRKE